jgi:hypothetical protein
MEDLTEDDIGIPMVPKNKSYDEMLKFLFDRLDSLDGLEDGKICKGKFDKVSTNH